MNGLRPVRIDENRLLDWLEVKGVQIDENAQISVLLLLLYWILNSSNLIRKYLHRRVALSEDNLGRRTSAASRSVNW